LEEDVRAGFGHSNWPPSVMVDGFLFLVGHSYPDLGSDPAPCTPGPDTLCLLGGRFRAEVAWRDFQGGEGAGHTVPGASDASGLFWFFSPENWELLVKVIDGCAAGGHFWVFAAATTTVEHTLTVTDTRTGRTVRYDNPPGRATPATTDTSAFECP
jgi:hypothetical protein